MPYVYKHKLEGPIYERGVARQLASDTYGKAMRESVAILYRKTVINFPVGATSIGRNSIKSSTRVEIGRGVRLIGVVESQINYVLFVETGTRPHTPPIAPLKLWAKRKYGDESRAWATRGWIKKHGTRPQRPFARAVKATQARIVAKLRSAFRTYEDTLNRG